MREAARRARARARARARLRARLTARARPGTFSIKFVDAPRVCSKGAKALQAVPSPKQQRVAVDEEASDSGEPLVLAKGKGRKRKGSTPGAEEAKKKKPVQKKQGKEKPKIKKSIERKRANQTLRRT